MKGQTLLTANDLWFAYEDGPPVLQGIGLTINAGDFVAVIGQNGSGKTTTVKHFNGLLRPSSGQILLNGEDIREKPVGELARTVGYVFQNPDHQIFSATTREEIAFGPRNLGVGDAEVQRRIGDALARFGLEAYANLQPAVLGFGLRRKVSVAAVYAMHTPVLILDEPTTGLDLRSTVELMQLISELNQQGQTIILITHDMRIVAEYVPRCMVLRDGQLLADDDTRTIFKQAELLRQTDIERPQVTELGSRFQHNGWRDDILTVSEFCDTYEQVAHDMADADGKR